jgi:hypothetical protein
MVALVAVVVKALQVVLELLVKDITVEPFMVTGLVQVAVVLVVLALTLLKVLVDQV